MNKSHYKHQVVDAVETLNHVSLDRLSKMLEQADQAKKQLRNKGYGVTGMDILETVVLVPDAPKPSRLKRMMNQAIQQLSNSKQ